MSTRPVAPPECARREYRSAMTESPTTPSQLALPRFAFLTPRTLPHADKLSGRVAVLDVAFASAGGGSSFEKTTLPFINGLGSRLAAWVDHHDHERNADYCADARFVLST